MTNEVTLRKSLSLYQVVYMGLAWMTPMIYFSIYGIAYENAHGMLTQAYLLAFIAIFFTAYSYGVMSKVFPTSGSAYTYTKKSIHPYLGFLVGWALLLRLFLLTHYRVPNLWHYSCTVPVHSCLYVDHRT